MFISDSGEQVGDFLQIAGGHGKTFSDEHSTARQKDLLVTSWGLSIARWTWSPVWKTALSRGGFPHLFSWDMMASF